MNMRSGFVIAAVSSGSGKTTVANGLMRAFVRKGLRVAPFKTGPDFIDTQFHRVAAGKESVNLDVFMSDACHVCALFRKYSAGCDVSVVEGVMGLFDGYERREGSAAHLAALTGLPVVLVINAASSAYSLAALLSGFVNFDRNIRIAGVIFNNVASDNHLRLLKAAARDAGVPFLGRLKRDSAMSVPSRHLGLALGDDRRIADFVDRSADAVETGVDMELLLRLTEMEGMEDYAPVASAALERKGRIAVAYDEAFNFVYPPNLGSLVRDPRFGGEIVRFSPLRDTRIPEADFLYLPGGYPELYARRLAENAEMRESVREYITEGGYALAECGGMLYLGREIDGEEMCGVLPLRATMEGARLHLGYRTVKAENFSIRGHEFHYSSVIEDGDRIKDVISRATQYDVRGDEVSTPLYRSRNAIAGYTHLYWGHCNISALYENLHT